MHGRRSGEQPTGPGKGGKSSRAHASRAREPSAAPEGNLRGSSGCTMLHPLQGLSPRQGLPEERGHPLTTPTYTPA